MKSSKFALSYFAFSNEDSDLINFSVKNSEQKLRTMKSDMNNSNLLLNNLLNLISNTDIVVLESDYHFRCLTAYRNKHHSMIRSKITDTENAFTFLDGVKRLWGKSCFVFKSSKNSLKGDF